MPGGFVPDGLFKNALHSLKIQPLDGILIGRVQTGLQFTVGRQPQPVALPAEMGIAIIVSLFFYVRIYKNVIAEIPE